MTDNNMKTVPLLKAKQSLGGIAATEFEWRKEKVGSSE